VTERSAAHEAKIARILLRTARELGEGLEPERVYERFQALLSEVIDHDGLLVSSFDPSDDSIRCEYVWNEGNVVDPSTLPVLTLNREGGGMQSRVIVSGTPYLFNNVPDEVLDPTGVYYNVDREGTVRRLRGSAPPGTTAAMMVPVKHEGIVVGVVQLMSDRAQYTADQVELFEGLVAQMAAAVRNSRLQRERRRLEVAEAAARAAAAEREQAAQVLEALGEGVFVLDEDGVVRLWNSAAERMTGLRGEDFRDVPLASVVPEWPQISPLIPVAAPGEATSAVAVPLQVGDRDLWLSFVAVSSDAGVIYAVRDLTSERRLDEEKSDLIATISHELRTPMTAVYGAAATLLHRESELGAGQRRELLGMIASEARRLAQITEEVLLASRLDRGDLRLADEAVNIPDVVRATIDTLSSQLPESVEIDVTMPSELRAGSSDRDRLQQVLLNLFENAVKYGGGRVKVRVAATNGSVRVSVADEGPGIAPVDQERIFEKFYRAEPHHVHGPSGTGLGLYIARELARRMGGTLAVSSRPGAGATFTLTLPRA
jgi:signal transduction histidine kinase